MLFIRFASASGAIALSLAAFAASNASAGCPGDLDGNGTVNGADLGELLAQWGTADGDLNNDGTTDGADLGDLLGNWGDCPVFAITAVVPEVLHPGETFVIHGSGFPSDPADICFWMYPIGSEDQNPLISNRRRASIISVDPENGLAVGVVSPIPVEEDQVSVVVAQIGDGEFFTSLPGLPRPGQLGPLGAWAWSSTENTLIVGPMVTVTGASPVSCSTSSWAPDPVLIGWASATITGNEAFCPPGTTLMADIHGDLMLPNQGNVLIHTDVFEDIVTTAPTTLAQCAFLICTALEKSLEAHTPSIDFQCIFLVTGPNSIKILINGDPGAKWLNAFGSLHVCIP